MYISSMRATRSVSPLSLFPRMAAKSLLLVLAVTLAAASVQAKQGFGDGGQEYGYVTVRENAHMFYWLYYVHGGEDPADKPLVIWLQGGPGASGAGYGNFYEIGPLDLDLNRRPSTWVNHVNLMFIDNPVGTGFSYVNDTEILSTDNQQIAADLVVLMKNFMTTYKQFQTIPIYIFSESYGGKMTVQFALNLYKEMEAGNIEINFKGIVLGDSWISPIDSVMSYGQYLLQTGMIDTNGYETVMAMAETTKKAMETGDWVNATIYWLETMDVAANLTGNLDIYNILTPVNSTSVDEATSPTPLYNRSTHAKSTPSKRKLSRCQIKGTNNSPAIDAKIESIMNNQVRSALGIIPENVTFYASNTTVYNYLWVDIMKPVTSIVEELLSETNLKVVVQTGQLDLIVDTPGTLIWVERLKWSGADYWVNSAERKALTVDGYVEGYYKTYGNFTFYWINRSGHMIPVDNPAASLEVLRQVTGYDQ